MKTIKKIYHTQISSLIAHKKTKWTKRKKKTKQNKTVTLPDGTEQLLVLESIHPVVSPTHSHVPMTRNSALVVTSVYDHLHLLNPEEEDKCIIKQMDMSTQNLSICLNHLAAQLNFSGIPVMMSIIHQTNWIRVSASVVYFQHL